MKAVVLLSKTFFPQHPKAGQPTGFAEKVHKEQKKHTCRSNYEYWKKKIDKLKAEGGVLSVRQWSRNPYRGPQEIIIDIPAEIIGVQKLTLWINKRTDIYAKGEKCPIHTICEWEAFVEGNIIPVSVLAKNDGLTLEDFKNWFKPVFEEKKANILNFAIIQFTTFRY
jgi:hypothetical protein